MSHGGEALENYDDNCIGHPYIYQMNRGDDKLESDDDHNIGYQYIYRMNRGDEELENDDDHEIDAPQENENCGIFFGYDRANADEIRMSDHDHEQMNNMSVRVNNESDAMNGVV